MEENCQVLQVYKTNNMQVTSFKKGNMLVMHNCASM